MEEGFFHNGNISLDTNTYLYHYHTCTLLITVVSNQELDWVLYTCSTINIWTFRMKKSCRLGDKKSSYLLPCVQEDIMESLYSSCNEVIFPLTFPDPPFHTSHFGSIQYLTTLCGVANSFPCSRKKSHQSYFEWTDFQMLSKPYAVSDTFYSQLAKK